MDILLNTVIYALSFLLTWFGAGLIISSVDRFSRKLRLSSFAVSFVILGIMTSTPEIAVGLTAVADHAPAVFVGNLLGGIPVIFLFVIPILAIFGNGINLKHDLSTRDLLCTLVVILFPSLLILDQRVTNFEGVVLIALYILLVVLVQRKHGFFDKASNMLEMKAYSYKDIAKVFLGIGIVFVTSQIIVDKTLYFSELLNVPAFYVSLILISLGTNLPEISLAIRSVISGEKDVAFGDYMGSAAANTLLFGIFTILNKGEVLTSTTFFTTFIFIFIALSLFYFFARSQNKITRTDGIILLSLYVVFVFYELIYK